MFVTTTADRVPFGAITILKLVNIAENATTALTTWNLNRITRRELSRLSDHQLEDIGLTRGDIQ
jgi:uncharacterized protein YjiS (DUF1127 family)